MSQAILLVAHGSRDREGVGEYLHFAAEVQAIYGEQPIYPCFLEFARPDILTALDQAVADGADRVILVPLFLLAARHMKQDMTVALQQAQMRYPSLPLFMASHLGLDARLTAILDDRLSAVTAAAPRRAEATTAVLLVGRGSRRPENNTGVYEVAESLRARRGLPRVSVCFAGLAHPNILEGIRQCVSRGAQRIILLPYLLFAGVLTKRIAAAATQVQFPSVEVLPARHLSGHHLLLDVVCDRIREVSYAPLEAAYV